MTLDHPPQEEGMKMVAHTSHVQTETWYAPMPRPQDYEHFEKVHPGSADRILAMAEKEQDARLADLPRAHRRKMVGAVSSPVLMIGSLIVAAYAIAKGQPAPTILGLVGFGFLVPLVNLVLRIIGASPLNGSNGPGLGPPPG